MQDSLLDDATSTQVYQILSHPQAYFNSQTIYAATLCICELLAQLKSKVLPLSTLEHLQYQRSKATNRRFTLNALEWSHSAMLKRAEHFSQCQHSLTCLQQIGRAPWNASPTKESWDVVERLSKSMPSRSNSFTGSCHDCMANASWSSNCRPLAAKVKKEKGLHHHAQPSQTALTIYSKLSTRKRTQGNVAGKTNKERSLLDMTKSKRHQRN